MLDKTLAAQPRVTFFPAYDPTKDAAGIRALTYEGMPMAGRPTRVFAYYGRPAGKDPVPGIVLVHGGGGHAYYCWVKMWVERGFAAIAMDTTGYFPAALNAGSREGDNALWTRTPSDGLLPEDCASAPDNCEMRDMDKPVDQQWMYHAVSDVILANTILRAMPGVDSTRVGLTGISWGGVLTSLVVGYDARFAFAVPVYGSGYMAPSLGFIAPMFRNEGANRLWRAEKRFDRVSMPVMWQCWNEDYHFSIEANSHSYEDTAANPMTCLCAIDAMRHSHYHAWIRPETYAYAEMICGMRPVIIRPECGVEGRNVIVSAPGARLRLYWIDQPMTYSVHESRFDGVRLCQDQPWHILDIQPSFTLPAEARFWYVECVWPCSDGTEYRLSTAYREA